MNIIKYIIVLVAAVSIFGCAADGDYPGLEFAPQMYHSVAYEPLKVVSKSDVPDGGLESWYYGQRTNATPYNDYKGKQVINMLLPVEGTIARQVYEDVSNSNVPVKDQPLLIYDVHKDSIQLAQEWKNPLPESKEILAEGKELYLSYCEHCHGEKGDGKGKVGAVYGGVPNYSSRAYSALAEGHIFFVITNGRNRMWPLKSQLDPVQRWKIVRYVQQLQKGAN